MTDCPWIDSTELDDLASRYPTLPRSRVELVLEAHWPMKDDVEATLIGLVACQQHAADESLDFTAPPAAAAAESRPL